MKITIYSLGGGWGHITRAAALASFCDARIIANSPYIGSLRGLNVHTVGSAEEAATAIEKTTDILVIDTFPRGLAGELTHLLPRVRAKKVLVHRTLNDEYVAWAKLRPYVAANFDCVICPGEKGPLSDLPQAITTAPWLVRKPRAAGTKVDVVVCAGGNTAELGWYSEVTALLAQGFTVRCLASEPPPGCPPDLWIRHWPAIDWLAAARAVVGGAGYNTVQECLALGVPLIAKPWSRKYDCQLWRARQHPQIRIVDTPQDAAAAARETLRFPRPATPPWRNGAEEAAILLQALL